MTWFIFMDQITSKFIFENITPKFDILEGVSIFWLKQVGQLIKCQQKHYYREKSFPSS